jgi:ubiquinone/menaquinone biosynthesis C-methylase UbiE
MPHTSSPHSNPDPFRDHVSRFFETEYRWWSEVYDTGLPQGFLSFEMRQRRQLILDLLRSRITPRDRLLDCGCGPGAMIPGLLPQAKAICALDLNHGFLQQVRQIAPACVSCVQADVENLPFASASFDILLSIGVLSYLQHDACALAEMARITRPGGLVVIALPNALRLNFLLDPCYLLKGAWQRGLKKLRNNPQKRAFSTSMIRRYHLRRFLRQARSYGLLEMDTKAVSFGPPTLFGLKWLPLSTSIRLSEKLRNFSTWTGLRWLSQVGNHWIICLQKTL